MSLTTKEFDLTKNVLNYLNKWRKNYEATQIVSLES